MLGEDEHGTWLWGPSGRTIYRGDEELFVTTHPALVVYKPDTWWAPTWWVGHHEVELYVNIGTPAAWSGDAVVSIDLDLDVVKYRDGRVEIVDRDELELHAELYGYPPEIIEAAEAATAEAYDMTVRGTPPFDGAAARAWVRFAESR